MLIFGKEGYDLIQLKVWMWLLLEEFIGWEWVEQVLIRVWKVGYWKQGQLVQIGI